MKHEKTSSDSIQTENNVYDRKWKENPQINGINRCYSFKLCMYREKYVYEKEI